MTSRGASWSTLDVNMMKSCAASVGFGCLPTWAGLTPCAVPPPFRGSGGATELSAFNSEADGCGPGAGLSESSWTLQPETWCGFDCAQHSSGISARRWDKSLTTLLCISIIIKCSCYSVAFIVNKYVSQISQLFIFVEMHASATLDDMKFLGAVRSCALMKTYGTVIEDGEESSIG